MTCALDATSPPAELHRVGRTPDPWQWPDWSFARGDTFGNRWDDPESEYRVLYASSQRLACFLETMGRFPKDPQVEVGLAEVELDADEVDHAIGPGVLVLGDWISKRRVGKGVVQGSFAAVGTSASLSYLHEQLGFLLDEFGLEELDAAAIRSGRRALTQWISRLVFECSTSRGARQFDGIQYLSRYGDEFENWAIFEPAILDAEEYEEIAPDDPDLVEAARRLNVTLV